MITKHSTTSGKIAESQDWLESLPTPSYIFSMESHRFLSANQRFLDLLGYTRSELSQLTIFDIRPPEDRTQLEQALSVAPHEGTREWRYTKKGGEQLKVCIRYRDMNQVLAPLRFEAARFVAILSHEPLSIQNRQQ